MVFIFSFQSMAIKLSRGGPYPLEVPVVSPKCDTCQRVLPIRVQWSQGRHRMERSNRVSLFDVNRSYGCRGNNLRNK